MKKRILAIDYLKGFLAIGMILGHSIQLLSDLTQPALQNTILSNFSRFVNLITFPAFFFCFGYAYYIAYFKKEFNEAKSSMLKNAMRILIAYYISAFSYRIFAIDGVHFTGVKSAVKVFLFSDIHNFSEFLLAFFLISLVSVLIHAYLKKYVSISLFWIITALSWLSPLFIPYNSIHTPQLGLFVGINNLSLFPILQYLCYFLIGIFVSKYKIEFNLKFLLISVLLSASFLGYRAIAGDYPSRFPPSIFWVSGSAFFVYGYYLISLWIEKKNISLPTILSIGNNTLIYLLLSNLMLFALHDRIKVSGIESILIGVVMIIIIYFITGLVKPVSKNRPATAARENS